MLDESILPASRQHLKAEPNHLLYHARDSFSPYTWPAPPFKLVCQGRLRSDIVKPSKVLSLLYPQLLSKRRQLNYLTVCR